MDTCNATSTKVHHYPKEKIVPKVLFILKQREDYSTNIPNFQNYTVSTGMYNSSKFVSDMLVTNGIQSQLAIVIDNNGIDKVVTAYKPTHVFIEGLWVVPEKFEVLKKLHPTVDWIIRCHSEIPFLAQEGMAIQWIFGYLSNGVKVSCNSPRANREVRLMALAKLNASKFDAIHMVPMLPNYYPVPNAFPKVKMYKKGVIDIACFGAIRPMKNQLIQALAAIEFAEKHRMHLRFHINAGRIESNGNNQAKNLTNLFANLPQYELVKHDWTDHDTFVGVMQTMDMSLQVSFSETFNLVTADAVTNGVPVIVSDEMKWVAPPYADPSSSSDIVNVMSDVWMNKRYYIKKNLEKLTRYSKKSSDIWVDYINERSVKEDFGITNVLLSGLKKFLCISCIVFPLIMR